MIDICRSPIWRIWFDSLDSQTFRRTRPREQATPYCGGLYWKDNFNRLRSSLKGHQGNHGKTLLLQKYYVALLRPMKRFKRYMVGFKVHVVVIQEIGHLQKHRYSPQDQAPSVNLTIREPEYNDYYDKNCSGIPTGTSMASSNQLNASAYDLRAYHADYKHCDNVICQTICSGVIISESVIIDSVCTCESMILLYVRTYPQRDPTGFSAGLRALLDTLILLHFCFFWICSGAKSHWADLRSCAIAYLDFFCSSATNCFACSSKNSIFSVRLANILCSLTIFSIMAWLCSHTPWKKGLSCYRHSLLTIRTNFWKLFQKQSSCVTPFKILQDTRG